MRIGKRHCVSVHAYQEKEPLLCIRKRLCIIMTYYMLVLSLPDILLHISTPASLIAIYLLFLGLIYRLLIFQFLDLQTQDLPNLDPRTLDLQTLDQTCVSQQILVDDLDIPAGSPSDSRTMLATSAVWRF